MPRFLLIVSHDGGVIDAPMDEWTPGEVAAHMNYYAALNQDLIESGELVGGTILAHPRLARIVRCDGASPPVVTDGPFPESKEVVAGFQVVDVESEARAIEIAARVSAVPGPEGVPLQQPIEVRQVMSGSACEP
jgi:hypothetical protein